MQLISKKVLSFLLTVCIVIGLLFTVAPSASAASWSGYDFAEGTLATRLNTIISNGITSDVSPSLPAVGGTFSRSQPYTVTLPGRTWTGYQCAAYAYAAYNYLFDCDPYKSSSVSFPSFIGKSELSYTDLNSAGIAFGAYLRTTGNSDGSYNASNGHSLLILSYDSSKIVTLEANASNGRYVAEIKSRDWSSFNNILKGKNRYVSYLCQPKNSTAIKSKTTTQATCTITFDPQGGSVSPTTKTVTKGSLIGEVPVPTRTGYTFTCWITESGTAVSGKNTALYVDSDMTLYANW